MSADAHAAAHRHHASVWRTKNTAAAGEEEIDRHQTASQSRTLQVLLRWLGRPVQTVSSIIAIALHHDVPVCPSSKDPQLQPMR